LNSVGHFRKLVVSENKEVMGVFKSSKHEDFFGGFHHLLSLGVG